MKIILTLTLLTICIVNAEGQLVSGYGLKLGVGISNYSWVYFDNYNLDFKNKIGISPRIFADFFDIPFFQLEGEIGFLLRIAWIID